MPSHITAYETFLEAQKEIQESEEKEFRSLRIAEEQRIRDQEIKALEAIEADEDGNNPKKMSVTEFNNNPTVIKNYDILTDHIKKNSGLTRRLLDLPTYAGGDISESMRDDFIRVSSMLNKATILKDAPEEVKKAYRDLRDTWENKTEIKGFNEGLQATFDYGIDFVSNYETIPIVLSALFSGGTSIASVQAAKAGLKNILKDDIYDSVSKAASTAAKSTTTWKGLTAYGTVLGAANDLADQNLLMSSDYQDAYDPLRTVITAGTSGVLTPLFGKGLEAGVKGSKHLYKKVRSKKDVKDIEDSLEVVPNDAPYENQIDIDFNNQEVVQETLDLGNPEALTIASQTVNDLNLDTLTNQTSFNFDDPNIDQTINNYVKNVNAGEATKEEIIDNLSSIAADDTLSPIAKQNKITFYLTKLGTDLLGKVIGGKSSGILTPYIKASPTARKLRSLLAHEFDETFKPLEPQQKQIGLDFFETATRYTGAVNERFARILAPLQLNQIKGTMSDAVTVDLNKAIRGGVSTDENINKAAREVQNLFKEMGEILEAEGLIDEQVENYIPRMWNRRAIKNNETQFKQLLVDEGEAANLDEANIIFKNLLDIKNQVGNTGAGHFFSAQRKFINIKNDSVFADFFEPDIMNTINQYTFQAGKALAKKHVLKSTNVNEFNNVWVEKIAKELDEAGITMTRSQRRDLLKLYKVTTGEVEDPMGGSEFLQNSADLYTIMNRTAYLSFATLSSLGEVFINIGKAGVLNAAKGFAEASELAFKTGFKNIHKDLQTRNGLTPAEAWLEMKRFNIGVNQAISQVGIGLGSDNLANQTMQNVSNKYFRIVLLDQWTRFVQTVSFATGKNLIEGDIKKLAKNGGLAASRSVNKAKGRLKELNINPEEALEWVKRGSKTDDIFYKKNILSGAARYTNSVILQPTAMSNLKPLWHSDPNTTCLFGLLSYPTAFGNTVLKGGIKQLAKNPETVASVALAAFLMANTARFTNFIRTRGKSEDKPIHEIYKDSIIRVGGNTVILDQIARAKRNADYSGNPLYYLGTPFGPAGSDVISLIDKRNPVQIAGEKVPFYSSAPFVFGQDAVKDYRENLKEIDRDIKEAIIGKRTFKNKGGIIDIPRAATEPDERIDKTTGIAYNEQAGTAFIDVLDRAKRETFNVGSVVSKQLSGYLSKQIGKMTDNMFNPEAVNKATDEIKQTVIPKLQRLQVSDSKIDNVVLSKVKSILSNSNLPRDKDLSVQDEYKISKDISQALKPLITKRVSLIDDSVDLTKVEDDSFSSLIKYTATRLLKNKNNADILTDEGAKAAAKNILAKIIKEDPSKLKDLKDISSRVPEKFDPATISADLKAGSREDNFKDMFKDSVVKTRLYRGISNMVDSDYEIGFAVPREMGVHVGNIGQANFILAKSLSRKANDLSIAARIQGGEAPTVSMKDYEDFFTSQYDLARRLHKRLGDEGGEQIPPLAMISGYVNLKKPLKYYGDLNIWSAENILTNFYKETVEGLEEGLGRSLNKSEESKLKKLQADVMKLRTDSDESIIESYINPNIKTYRDIKERFDYALMDKKFQNYLKDLGFDGIEYNNFNETPLAGENLKSYILFEPTQFKNTNAISFDPEDPRDMVYGGGRLSYNEGSIVGSYKIKQGDTLVNISKKYNTTTDILLKINNLQNLNDISVDDVINISVPNIKNKAVNAIKNIQSKRPKNKAVRALSNLKESRQNYSFGSKVAKPISKGIYSALEEAADWIENRGAKEAEGEHYINIIKKAPNVTNDEIEWSGVGDKLKVKRTFTKQEVQDMLKNSPAKLKIAQSGKDFESEYSKYTLAGDDTVPTRIANYDPTEADMPAFRPEEEDATVYDDIDPMEQALMDFEREEARVGQEPVNYKEFLFLAPTEGKFKNVRQRNVMHFDNFQDANKTLFHVRLSQGTDLETYKPLTIIEEMQSDYHTVGRQEGYTNPKKGVNLKIDMVEKDEILYSISNDLKQNAYRLYTAKLIPESVKTKLYDIHDSINKLDGTELDINETINTIYEIDKIQSKFIGDFAKKYNLDPLEVRRELAQKHLADDAERTGLSVNNNVIPIDMIGQPQQRMLSNMRFYIPLINTEIVESLGIAKKLKPDGETNELKRDIVLLTRNLVGLSDFKLEYFNFLKDKVRGTYEEGIADAPFKDTWYKSAINKAVLEAINEGHSGVALTKADTHAKRYAEEYRKGFEFVYDNKGKSYLNKLGKRYGLEVEDETIMVDTVENIDNPPADVFVLRFNDELIEDLKEKGLPQFAEGGEVKDV